MNSKRCLVTGWLVLAVATLPALAQEVDLQKALDKPVTVSVDDAPIGELFGRLSTETGVKIVIDPDTMALLPYGPQTRLRVRMTNATLRNALTPTLEQPGLLAPQALRWTIEGDAVRIVPSEALYRLGKRATYDELTILGTIYSTKLQPVSEGSPGVLDQLRKASGASELRLVGSDGTAPTAAAIEKANAVLPANGATWLDALAGKGQTWFVQGDDIIILSRREQVERQLARNVSIKYQNAQLADVLLDLARLARLSLTMEPGVLAGVPAATRNSFNLTMSDATVAQALEVISGATGLKFARTDEGLRVEPTARSATAETGPAQPRPRFFVRMSIPGPEGSNIEVFLRPEELPPDVLDRIEREKQKFIERLSEPATQPARQ